MGIENEIKKIAQVSELTGFFESLPLGTKFIIWFEYPSADAVGEHHGLTHSYNVTAKDLVFAARQIASHSDTFVVQPRPPSSETGEGNLT